jgi:aldose 1-epimerase
MVHWFTTDGNSLSVVKARLSAPVAIATLLVIASAGTRWSQAREPDAGAVAGAPATAKSPLEGKHVEGKLTVRQESFGKSPGGNEETLFTCRNAQGCELQLTTYGARIVSLTVPDKDGKLANVVLGFDSLAAYVAHKSFFGCTTGRFANRIAGGRFELDGKPYTLAINGAPNSLHGGLVGFDRRHWNAKPIESQDAVGVEFTYRSPDGEEGYPGNLDVKVVYTWSNDNVLTIDYSASTDAKTIINLTNHAYWNLGGVAGGKPIEGTILDEELVLAASRYLPTDATSIPTGELAPVKGTVMDFTTPHRIGERIETLKQPPSTTKGYDHCYVLDSQDGKLALAARVSDPKSGRIMEVLTTEPGIQLYCGNFLVGDEASGGFHQHDALCLETQHYPDAPNRPNFPTTTLKPRETYRQQTVHRFSVK